MPPRKDPIETMSPAEKLLRVGVIGGTAFLLLLATVSSFRDGPGQSTNTQVAEAPAAEEGGADVASADAPSAPAPEPEEVAAEITEASPVPEAEDALSEQVAQAEPDTAEESMETEPAPAEDVAEAEADPAEDAVTEAAEAPAVDPVAAEDAGPVDWLEESPLLASADIDAGESAFRQCSACHQYAAERNAGGPHLVGIVGREVGAVGDWRYSNALQDAGGIWTPERLEQWLTNPDDYLPGNRMAYPGVRGAQERIDIIGFLAAQAQ